MYLQSNEAMIPKRKLNGSQGYRIAQDHIRNISRRFLGSRGTCRLLSKFLVNLSKYRGLKTKDKTHLQN